MKVRSWDCFDTIIGRKLFYPRSIFSIVAQKINDPSFINKRILAEKNSKLKTYEDIYNLLPGYDPEIEFNTELEQTFPIRCNFDRIQDGDIIISDMYLNSDRIHKILQHHGLNKDVTIYSSPHGKRDYSMWGQVINKHDISIHTGDNMLSDVINPRLFGIKAAYFPGKTFTRIESKIGLLCENLTYLMRTVRLSCPYRSFYDNSFVWEKGSFREFAPNYWLEEKNGRIYQWWVDNIQDKNKLVLYKYKKENNKKIKYTISITRNGCITKNNKKTIRGGDWLGYIKSDEARIWYDQSQYNVPALITTAKQLPSNNDLIFTERDCWYLKSIYDKLHNKNSPMLHVSRRSYRFPYNQEYIDYILDNTKNRTIIDLHGSGESPSLFFGLNNKDAHILYVGLKTESRNSFWGDLLENTLLTPNISFCIGYNNADTETQTLFRCLEKLNIHNIGELCGYSNNTPIRSFITIPETIQNLRSVQEEAMGICLDYLLDFSFNSSLNIVDIFRILKTHIHNSDTEILLPLQETNSHIWNQN